jgi:2-polyprenyl-3-methyl-5-hydroxy-6-metoxy-1,4-benzoquinol methylase
MVSVENRLPLGPKPRSYYAQERADVVAHLPRPVGRVLDVGCGEGGAAYPLRQVGATWISGIEIVPGAAAVAAERYDEVVVGDAVKSLGRVKGPFDTILCYDVLEHLTDPSDLVRKLRILAGERAVLHVSVPNARHVSLLCDLLFRGTFGYTEWGHRDATHLRWFTRKDMTVLLGDSGWCVESVDSSAAQRLRELRLRLPELEARSVGHGRHRRV